VSSTSIAFVNAARAIGAARVAVVASYPDDVAQHFVEFLTKGQIEVTAMGSHDIITAAEVGRLTRDQVVQMVAEADQADADALLVPDTAMHSLLWLEDLEEAAGRPVLTANQVTVWEGMRRAGDDSGLDGMGALFRA